MASDGPDAVLADIMTRNVHVVAPFTPVASAARTMDDNRVGAVPVVDASGVVAGLLSLTDLVTLFMTAPRAPSTARDVMSAPAVVAPPTMPVAQAARLMDRLRIRHLPVVDHEGRLQGIVSRGDLLRLFLRGDHEPERRPFDRRRDGLTRPPGDKGRAVALRQERVRRAARDDARQPAEAPGADHQEVGVAPRLRSQGRGHR